MQKSVVVTDLPRSVVVNYSNAQPRDNNGRWSSGGGGGGKMAPDTGGGTGGSAKSSYATITKDLKKLHESFLGTETPKWDGDPKTKESTRKSYLDKAKVADNLSSLHEEAGNLLPVGAQRSSHYESSRSYSQTADSLRREAKDLDRIRPSDVQLRAALSDKTYYRNR